MGQPSGNAIHKALDVAGPLARIESIEQLSGGTHATTYLIDCAEPKIQMILREFPSGDAAPSNEVLVLGVLDNCAISTPKLLAFEVTRASGMRPWLLTSYLPGQGNITPADSMDWAMQLGRTLAEVHKTPRNQLTRLRSVFDTPAGTILNLKGPAREFLEPSWKRFTASPRVLCHCDFWSGNVVWNAGVLSGIVDWSGAGVGPAEFDVGWCRLDLFILFDEHIADVFLNAYQEAAELPIENAMISDLWALARSYEIVETWVPNYAELGRIDLTATRLRHRHSQWIKHALDAKGG